MMITSKTHSHQIMLFESGLRGAIAFSLALSLDPIFILNRELFLTTTLFIILFTVFFLGITTKPMIKFLDVKLLDEEQEAGMFIAIQERIFDTIMSGIAEISDVRSTHSFTLKFHRINENFLKRFLTKGDMHAFEHTLEAVKDKSIRRSTRVSKEKPSHDSVIVVEGEPVEFHKKPPLESVPSADDSVFEEVNLRNTPAPDSRRPAEVKFRDRSSTGIENRGSEESLRRTHLRHTMHGAEGRRAGKNLVTHMFYQNQYYHLPLRDSIVSERRTTATSESGPPGRDSTQKYSSRKDSELV